MADTKISALTAATTPLAGTEVLPIVQSGVTKQVSVANLTAGRAVSGLTFTSTVATGTAPFTVSSTTEVANLTAANATNATTAANLKSNATTGVMQIVGPAASSTRVMTIPDANFTAARTDAGQTFTGSNTFSSDLTINGITAGRGVGGSATNTAFGNGALSGASNTGTYNTALGLSVLQSNTTGTNNVGVGTGNRSFVSRTLESNQTGSYNVAVGNGALGNLISGSNNTAIGQEALSGATGSNTTAIGYAAGTSATNGSNNGFFGYNAQPSAGNVSNEYTYGDSNVTVHRFYGNLTPLGAAKGINFTANTGAAGKTSQLLNWYEEGTWTPGIAFGGGSTGVTYNTSFTGGQYTRIGNKVFVQGYLLISNVGSSTGDATITGLPFTSKSGSTNYLAVNVLFESSITFTGSYGARIAPNQTAMDLFQYSTAGALTFLSKTNFSNGATIYIAAHYTV